MTRNGQVTSGGKRTPYSPKPRTICDKTDDGRTKDLKATQIAQNRMLRLLDGSRVRDRRSIGDMLERVDVLSINQTTALIKLLEAWKANKHQDYPVCLKKKTKN